VRDALALLDIFATVRENHVSFPIARSNPVPSRSNPVRPSSRAKSQISNPRDDATPNRIESNRSIVARVDLERAIRDRGSRVALRTRARSIATRARSTRATVQSRAHPSARPKRRTRRPGRVPDCGDRPIGRADATFASHGFRARARDAMVLKDT